MDKITDRLAALDPGTAQPSTDAVDADLRRGRRALGRRRVRVGATVAVVALVATSTSLIATSGSGDTPAAQHRTTTGASRAGKQSKIRLVAYTGEQDQGYEITQIPAGFDLELQSSTPATLVIAKQGDDSSPDAFVNKLVITAEDHPSGTLPDGQPATVNGAPASISDGPPATSLYFFAHGLLVDVQAWDNIGLTDDQLIQFADGITVTDQVQVVHG